MFTSVVETSLFFMLANLAISIESLRPRFIGEADINIFVCVTSIRTS